jgi:hypothetical protein
VVLAKSRVLKRLRQEAADIVERAPPLDRSFGSST